MDANGQPLTNAAIVQAMASVSAHDTPEARALLFRLLLDATLLVVTRDKPDRPVSWTAKQGESLNLVTLHDPDGTVLAVFTSLEALTQGRSQGAGYLALPSRGLFEMAAAANTNKIALNPGSETWGFLTRREIESLARGRLPLGPTEVVAEEAPVRIGRPSVPPAPEALEALRTAMRAEPRAERAWYFLMQQENAQPELFVAIRLTAGVVGDEERSAMRGIIDRAGSTAEPVKSLGFLVATDHWRSSLESGSGEAFFRR